MIEMKRTTIAITGLPKAGKTCFTQRLITGNLITSQPTFGVDVEFASYKDLPLQIWDMGGHMAFRTHIWENYIKMSSGLIYIFDASDLSQMEESAEWFWKCFSWIEDKKAPILFLANKWDLVKDEEVVINSIVEGFRLNEIALKSLDSPFRFFFISVKTGAYISDAMNWLVVKQFIEKRKFPNKILSLDVFVKIGNSLAHIHDNSQERNEVLSTIDAYKKKFEQSGSEKLNLLEEMSYDNHKVLYISHSSMSLLVISEEDFIDRAGFSIILEKIKTEESYEDINEFYTLYENVKESVLKNFHTDISSTLSCDLLITN
ncbi:MAG: GTP-binding protein [Candidatus Heimdallarchaeota archaeon]|nr:GTP-binding protein [Candidatus Heimdallarchaeota archaeon]MCK4876948.1 GTP-binding protein [Candidatus Heimdallarchaeota archaeon]